MTTPQTKKKSPNIVPYIISFAILFLISLLVLTWVLDVFNKSYGCTYQPNIWCSDSWRCQNLCTTTSNGKPVNSCFNQTFATGPTGLASCLFGPNSPGATACFFPPEGDDPTAVACDCPSTLKGTNVQNCFNNCARDTSSVGGTATCCCNDINNLACAVNASGIGTGICAPTN